jgi:P27 family predicted phage terminase small subunit
MATRGRKPIPTKQSTLMASGSAWAAEPPPEVADDPAAVQAWGEAIAALRAVGTLHWADAAIVARYAMMRSLWLRCVEDARAHGATMRTRTGYEATRPSIATACKIAPQLLQIEAHLGLTPRGRSRLRATPQDEPNELEKFLAEGA